jgi:uncharacterized protein
MRVVVTGITGLIGGALAASLRHDGHEVLGVSRTAGPDMVVWDLEAGTLDALSLEGTDAVVHLAGESVQGRWTKQKRARLTASRIGSTTLLAETIGRMDAKPGVFVSGSAIGIYGDCGDVELDEESATSGGSFLSDLSLGWEAATAPIAAMGVRVNFARTGLVLAPGGGALAKMATLTRFGAGGRLGDGQQFWSWISLDDEVAALRHLIDSELEGPVNLVSPLPVRQRDFARMLGEVLRRPTWLPAPAIGIRLALGEMGRSLLLDSARVFPRVLDADGYEFRDCDLEATLRAMLNS